MKLKRKVFSLKGSFGITEPDHLFDYIFLYKLLITFNKPFTIIFIGMANIRKGVVGSLFK